MFSVERQTDIERQFNCRLQLLGDLRAEVLAGLMDCTADESYAVKFLYGAMPLSDAGNYSFETFLDYARQGVHLWKNGNWTDRISEDLFLDYILYHRVNNEDIQPCRSFFYEKISDRVRNLTMEQAALEVNFWCAEEAAYRTSDDRTVAPITVCKTGYGRCGEESVFTVSALRSVGIPARQVYVPRWSHCDDNHAWVEVWCEGTWYFMGACEPEEVLNRGWFTDAASRAMLVHSKLFSSNSAASAEDIIGQQGMVTLFNQSSRYAPTRIITIRVIDAAGEPVIDAHVDFEVLNFSEFYPVASLKTNDKGIVCLDLGLGSVHVHVSKSGAYAEEIINTNEKFWLQIELNTKRDTDNCMDIDMYAPTPGTMHINQTTREQKEKSNSRLHEAEIRRRQKSMHYEQAISRRIETTPSHWNKNTTAILDQSSSNWQEIMSFFESPIAEPGVLKEALMSSLTAKDYSDCQANVLIEHLCSASEYEKNYNANIFIPYVLAPRIHLEPLSKYRTYIRSYYSEEQKKAFADHPQTIWQDIENTIADSTAEDFEELFSTPAASLHLKAATRESKKILFVAVCRSLGMPARLNPIDLSIEFYQDGKFRSVVEKNSMRSVLRIYKDNPDAWIYRQNWSLAVLTDGRFQTLNLEKEQWQGNILQLQLIPGIYRLVTTNRLPNGNIFARTNTLSLIPGRVMTTPLVLRNAEISSMLESIEIADFDLESLNGSSTKASKVTHRQKSIFIWLDEGKEPTEHILNELYEKQKMMNRITWNLVFLLRSKDALQNPTLVKTLEALPGTVCYLDDFSAHLPIIGRKMYVDPDKLPLIILMDGELHGIFATSGYNVGTVDMLLRIMEQKS